MLVKILIVEHPLRQGGNPDDRGNLFLRNGLTYLLVVCGIQEYDLSTGANTAEEALGECQIMTDRTSDEGNILWSGPTTWSNIPCR